MYHKAMLWSKTNEETEESHSKKETFETVLLHALFAK